MKSTTITKEKVTLEAIGELIERSISALPARHEMKMEITSAISNLATKDEIAKLATKDELNKLIDDLAGAVNKGFFEVHEKIEQIESKIERMDNRFTNQLDYFNIYYPTKNEFNDLDKRMTKVEKS